MMNAEAVSSSRPEIKRGLFTAIALASLALAACAGPAHQESASKAQISEAPLGGEALVQRKHDLRRALRDLRAYHTTMASLVDRRDTGSISLFDAFLANYMERHLDPLLSSGWQSDHAELAAVDASLRFAKAELLIQMRYPRRVQRVIDELERRYEGRDDLLVEYPIGRQGKLGEGLELLRDRKWMG